MPLQGMTEREAAGKVVVIEIGAIDPVCHDTR
jgi:hypothetical protein